MKKLNKIKRLSYFFPKANKIFIKVQHNTNHGKCISLLTAKV